MVMLDLFCQIQVRRNLDLQVVHVHHGLRGKEADEDLAFVEKLAFSRTLPCHSRKVDAGDYAKTHKLSIEDSARVLRYQVFEEILAKTGFDKLATAHTAHDQAETVIDRFLRGSGAAGLRGIPASRGAYVRPLLRFGRDELRLYAQQRDLAHREDSMNQQLQYRRNRIRHELIPYLEEHFNPNLIGTLNRTAEIFRETEAFLNVTAAEAFKSLVSLQKKNEIIVGIEGFLKYNRLIQKYILFHCCKKLSLDRRIFSFPKINSLLEIINKREVGKTFKLDPFLTLQIDHDGLVIRTAIDSHPPSVEVNFLSQKSIKYLDYQFQWSILDSERHVVFDPHRNVEFFDFEKTGTQLKMTCFYPGAWFTPLNFAGKKKVAAFFSDMKIPLHLRERIPILVAPNGIVWICGYQIDDKFKVTENTRTVLKMEMSRTKDG